MTSLTDSTDNTIITFGYDNADRLTTKSLPNGINTVYTYDGMSRLTRMQDTSSTATLFDRQYGYNNANQIETITEPNNSRTFGYDFVDRLKTTTASNNQNESYNYDDVGNRTSSFLHSSYGYGTFNKVTSATTPTQGTNSYKYNENGSMTRKAESKDLWRYNFDHENRLTFAKNRRERVNYQYDALGRRVKTSNFLKGTTKYTYDGLDVVQDDDSSTGITKYQNGLGIDNKLKLKNGSNSSYFLADHLGSTNGLTNSSGSLTSSASYDSFGNKTGNLATRYQFTGREKDDVTGLYYYRARFYDSKLGRFISEDPIGFNGGDVNLYGYVWNNPQNFTDPTGNFPFLLGRYTYVSLDELQGYLAIGGLVPGIGEPLDLIDGGISLCRGNYYDAALSAGAMVPYLGTFSGITKTAKRGNNIADGLKLKKSLASAEQMSQNGTTMAGKGSNVPFRDAPDKAAKYGGKPDDYVKKASTNYSSPQGQGHPDMQLFETHWVENIKTGQRFEYKTKFPHMDK